MVKMISEFKDGEHISGQFLVNASAKCVNNQGSAYMNLELKDASGTINGKKWEASLEDESIYAQGNVVFIEAEVLKYKDSLQVKILSGEIVDPKDIDVVKFIKQPPVPKEEYQLIRYLYQRLDNNLRDRHRDPPLRQYALIIRNHNHDGHSLRQDIQIV